MPSTSFSFFSVWGARAIRWILTPRPAARTRRSMMIGSW